MDGWMEGEGFDVIWITTRPSERQPMLDLELCVSWNVGSNSRDSWPLTSKPLLSVCLSLSHTHTNTHMIYIYIYVESVISSQNQLHIFIQTTFSALAG